MIDAARDDAGLTARELEVLRLMADGHNNAQIAINLFVSENTVKTHVSKIFDKLGCRDRAAAVLQAWKRHVI
jgi:DNA-binding NarL/FixJ family response regulator